LALNVTVFAQAFREPPSSDLLDNGDEGESHPIRLDLCHLLRFGMGCDEKRTCGE